MKIENLKIALVHDRLIKWGGAELVLKIFHEMFPRAPIFTLVYDEKGVKSRFAGADIRTSFIQKLPNPSRYYNFYLPLMPKAIESFCFDDFDLVISICHSFSKGIKTNKKTKHICYLLTPTRFLWHQKINNIFLSPILAYLRKWDYRAAQRPDQIVSISICVKERTKKYYDRDSDIIFPPVEMERFKISDKRPASALTTGQGTPSSMPSARFGGQASDKEYYLIVSRLEPHKKVNLAIETFNQLGWPLKVIGTGSELNKLKKLSKKNIEFLGELSDNKVSEYYQKCLAFIYPQEEDFGITALEAQANGKPVIAYGQGGVLDTVKSGVTGDFFEEQTSESLVKILKQFNPDKYNPDKIKNWAETFSTEKFKKKWRKYLENIYLNTGS